MKEIEGVLEVDEERGVIYFHSKKGYTLLRLSSLPKPIPEIEDSPAYQYNLVHMEGVDCHKTKKD